MRSGPARLVRSPLRRAHSRSRSPARPRDRSRSVDRKRVDSRRRSPTPSRVISEARSEPLQPVEQEQKLSDNVYINPKPSAPADPIMPPVAQESKPRLVTTSEQAPAATNIQEVAEVPASPQSKEEPLWKPEDTTQLDKDGIPLIEKRGILLPESYWQYVLGKASSNDDVQKESDRQIQIQYDPIWQAMQDLTAQYAPVPANMVLEPVLKDMSIDIGAVGEEDDDSKNFEIPAYDAWTIGLNGSSDSFFKHINSKVSILPFIIDLCRKKLAFLDRPASPASCPSRG
jgi:hypothetical protein